MAGPRAAKDGIVARILRFCPICEKEAPHEVRSGSHGLRVSCVRCRERALLEELDRD